MKITWYGTATIAVKTETSKVLFDPYLKSLNETLPRLPLETFADVEAIFITHPHFDHFADLPQILDVTDCPIYVNARGVKIASKQHFPQERLREIKPGDTVNVGDVQLTAYLGAHVRYDAMQALKVLRRALRGRFRQACEIGRLNRKYSIKLSDVLCYEMQAEGKTVLLMGSAGLAPDVQYTTGADLLILPYQGRSDMCDYCVDLANHLAPRYIMLDHYDNAFPPISEAMDTDEFVRDCGISVIVPVEGVGVTVR